MIEGVKLFGWLRKRGRPVVVEEVVEQKYVPHDTIDYLRDLRCALVDVFNRVSEKAEVSSAASREIFKVYQGSINAYDEAVRGDQYHSTFGAAQNLLFTVESVLPTAVEIEGELELDIVRTLLSAKRGLRQHIEWMRIHDAHWRASNEKRGWSSGRMLGEA